MKKIVRIADDGTEVVDDNSSENETLNQEEQEASIDSMAEAVASDHIALESSIVEAEEKTLAAEAVLNDLVAQKKRGGSVTASDGARSRLQTAITSLAQLDRSILKTDSRAQGALKSSERMTQSRATTRQKLSEYIKKAQNLTTSASDKYVTLETKVNNLKKKLAYLFHQEDTAPTYDKSYSDFDYETDIKPRKDDEAASTIVDTADAPFQGWREQDAGPALNKMSAEAIAKSRRISLAEAKQLKAIAGMSISAIAKRLNLSIESAKKLRAVALMEDEPGADQMNNLESDIPSPSDGEDTENTDGNIENLEIETARRHNRNKRAVYNDSPEYSQDSEIEQDLEDELGEAWDHDHSEESEPGTLVGRRNKRNRRAFGDDMDTDLDMMDEPAYDDSMFEDGVHAEDDDSGEDKEETASAYAALKKKGFVNKAGQVTKIGWRLIKRIADGEEPDADEDDDEKEESAEAAAYAMAKKKGWIKNGRITQAGWRQVKRVADGEEPAKDEDDEKSEEEAAYMAAKKKGWVKNGNITKSGLKQLIRRADDEESDDDEKEDKKESRLNRNKKANKRRRSFGNDLLDDNLLMDDDLDNDLEPSPIDDDMDGLDNSLSPGIDDGIYADDEEDDDDEMEDDDDSSEDVDAGDIAASKKRRQNRVSSNNKHEKQKFISAMNLVGMMRIRKTLRSPLVDATAKIIASEFKVPTKRAELLARRAQMAGYPQEIQSMFSEAEKLMQEFPESERFVAYRNRVANQEIPDKDQLTDVESWDNSDTFNNSYEEYAEEREDQNKSARKASQDSSKEFNIDDIIKMI